MQTFSINRPLAFNKTQQSNTKQINDYLIDLNALIGEGSFSKVYKATNTKTNQVVAVKIIQLSSLKTDTLVKLLQSEIDLLKSMKHPNVLNCYQVLSSSNNCYIVTQYCNGGDLETYLQNHGTLNERDFKKIIYEIYQGLKYIAGLNIIHRDFKIANIFLNNGVAKLADFGFAQKLKHAQERFSDVNIGSPVYMAPQAMIQNTYGPKTDVWSFGVFLFEILHGDTPLGNCETQQQLFAGARRQITHQQIKQTVNPLLRDLIIKCLQVDERRRISVAQIANQPYMIQIQNQITKQKISLKQIPKTVVSLGIPKNIEQSNAFSRNTINSTSLLNIPPNQRTLSYMSIGPSVASQMVIHGNTESRLNHLNTIVPTCNSQIVLLNGRSSNNLLTSTNNSIQRSPLQTSILRPQTLSFSKQSIKPLQRITTTLTKPKINNIIPTNILKFKISFSQCVQLLHYCRLIHKCIITGYKITSCSRVVDYLSAWLLAFTQQLKNKCLTFVQFDGQRAPLREKKLSDLVQQYYVKYKQELKTTIANPNFFEMRTFMKDSLAILDRDIHLCKNAFESDLMMRQSHFLAALYQINIQIQKSSLSGDFSRLALLKMDEFLNRPNESFNQESYNQVKSKLINLLR